MVAKIFLVFTFIVITAGLFPFWNIGWWWVRAFDFPRLQIFSLNLILLLTLGTGFVFRYNSYHFFALTFVLLICLVLDLYRIYPYAISRTQESLNYNNEDNTGHISILTCNVLMHNQKYYKILELIQKKNPDIILLLETDKKWVEATQSLETNYPNKIILPQQNGYGKIFYSKYPLKNTVIKHLVDKTVPSIFTDIEINQETTLHFIGLHPRPPRPHEGDSDQRDSELMLVAEYISSRKNDAILVAGDLNDVAWSHTTRLFRRVSGTLDPRIGRGMFNTFHANYIFFRYPLDHFFHTKKLMVAKIARLEHVGSDHFPLWAKFYILKNTTNKQKPETEEPGDKKEMNQLQERGKDWVSPGKSKDDPLDESSS